MDKMKKLILLNLILLAIPELCLSRSVKEGIVRIPVTTTDLTPTTILSFGSDFDQTYLRVLLTTASSEMWVPSADCNWEYTWCRQHGHYNYRESHSYVDSQRNFTTHFLDHTLTGRVSADQVEVGDVILTNIEFGEAISSDTDFDYSDFDGVLGLGPKRVSTTGAPLLAQLLDRGLDDAVFSFTFSSGESGSLVIGGVQHDSYTGDLVWSKIVSEERWQIQPASISMGPHVLCSENCVTEFDTEIEVIIGPSEQVEQLYLLLDAREIPGVTIRSVDCTKVDSFPDFTFTIKGQKLNIAPKDYVDRTKISATTEICILMITSVEDDVDRWIMGTLAHKPLYVVYDFGRYQVGLAEAV